MGAFLATMISVIALGFTGVLSSMSAANINLKNPDHARTLSIFSAVISFIAMLIIAGVFLK